jgi:hypothetical protein
LGNPFLSSILIQKLPRTQNPEHKTQNLEPKSQNPNTKYAFRFQNPERLKFKISRPPQKESSYKNVCLTGPSAKSGPWAFQAPKPRTQNPKPLKYCFFEGVRKYSNLFSPTFLPSPNYPIDRTEKNVQSAGFHTCFSHGNIVVPMVLRWLMLCTPKFYPKYFYSKYSKLFFPVDTRRVGKMHILCRRPCFYIYIII